MRELGIGPSTVKGLDWLVKVGPAPLEAWGVAMGWGRTVAYSHAQRLAAAGWLETCFRRRGVGRLLYASRVGVRESEVRAAPVEKEPAPVSWPHFEACAWTAAWLSARGREMVGPRQMLVQDGWSDELRWREHGELRRRGHRPDLAIRLSDGRLMPIEAELTEKSIPRLQAVIGLYGDWVVSGRRPAVMYVCATEEIAKRVNAEAERIGLSTERGTLRVELLSAIRHQAVEACVRRTANDWHLAGTGVQ